MSDEAEDTKPAAADPSEGGEEDDEEDLEKLQVCYLLADKTQC